MSAALSRGSVQRLLTRWPPPISCRSEAHFAFGVSALWLLLYNSVFWTHTAQAMWRPSFSSICFLISAVVLVFCLQATLLLLAPTQWLQRAAASALSLLGACSSYFVLEYGALMDKDMLRSVLETDAAEIRGLLSLELILYLALLGVLPAWLIWRVSLPPSSPLRELRRRSVAAVLALLVAGCGVMACSAQYAVYLRAYKPIRFELSPAAPLVSAIEVLTRMAASESESRFEDLGGLATRVGPPSSKPLVVFVVIGETARGANFQLAGYPRATTPQLAAMSDVVYFSNVSACGTSTAISVPCIFSPLGRSQFDVDESSHASNVLDSLVKAGFHVEWRDNNAGCKGVCARVATVRYAQEPSADACDHAYCYDEAMLKGLDAQIRSVTQDTAIVFHQIGSHGPAYWERYPPAFEQFRPSCRSNELHLCSKEELVNAYDNTIAYTDRVLAQQIAALRRASAVVDSVLIYVSDHGESLGENGLYLHGAPYLFAPREQKHVPMLLWFSEGYRARLQLDRTCLKQRKSEPFTHDNLYHTILGAAGVRDEAYKQDLDILAGCRQTLS